MGKKQPTEHSPLLGEDAVSLHDAADASPAWHHGGRSSDGRLAAAITWLTRRARRYKRELLCVGVVAAVVAALLAFAFFCGGTTPSIAVVGTIDDEEVRSLAVFASM